MFTSPSAAPVASLEPVRRRELWPQPQGRQEEQQGLSYREPRLIFEADWPDSRPPSPELNFPNLGIAGRSSTSPRSSVRTHIGLASPEPKFSNIAHAVVPRPTAADRVETPPATESSSVPTTDENKCGRAPVVTNISSDANYREDFDTFIDSISYNQRITAHSKWTQCIDARKSTQQGISDHEAAIKDFDNDVKSLKEHFNVINANSKEREDDISASCAKAIQNIMQSIYAGGRADQDVTAYHNACGQASKKAAEQKVETLAELEKIQADMKAKKSDLEQQIGKVEAAMKAENVLLQTAKGMVQNLTKRKAEIEEEGCLM